VSHLQEILRHGISPLRQQLETRRLRQLEHGFQVWFQNWDRYEEGHEDTLSPLLTYLIHEIDETLETIEHRRGQRVEFDNRYAHAVTERERQTHVLDFARRLGAGRVRLARDRRAFARWFGRDAVLDRYHRQHGELEQRLSFILDRLGWLSELAVSAAGEGAAAGRRFRALQLDKVIEPMLAYAGDHRVPIEAFACLSRALQGLPREERETSVKSNILRYIYRAALDHHLHLWIQCEALHLLQHLSLDSFVTAVTRRLSEPADGDDIFLRRRAVLLVGANLEERPRLQALLEQVCDDPSPWVRQALPEALAGLPEAAACVLMERLVIRDPSPQVRAAALQRLPALLGRPGRQRPLLEILLKALQDERDDFVLRTALESGIEGHRSLLEQGAREMAKSWQGRLLPRLERLHRAASSLAVRRWAARVREHLWCQSESRRLRLREELQDLSRRTRPGRSRRAGGEVRRQLRADRHSLGRILALVSEHDHGHSLAGNGLTGARLHRGDRFGFRLWRLLHELLHPATDKRQAFTHTRGRIAHGRLRAPPAYLAELTPTRVPGEPLYIAEEDGWRPYLPLVDEVISCLDEGLRAATVDFYTSEGVTRLQAPRGLAARLRARTILSLRFASYARLRNWQPGTPANAYLKALQSLGFRIELLPHANEADLDWKPDPQVARFFPLALPGIPPEFLGELKDYFFSVYENTLYELVVFLALVAGLFLGRHILVNRRIRRARRSLSLVIGGWGTRGKSGTERIKAALFNALGYSVISKTTGTEAMFLQGHRFGSLGEMFLFRPYDKATIWEQANVLRLAEAMHTDVFLWECMGLTPSYVNVLQQDWMRDDIVTLTNAYPDHEDLQGPAGINIPEVMTNFIPPDATLISSEEHMLPILREAAERRGTRVIPVNWLDAGLLPEDVLARFPYDEHPNNIALVLAMADELGVARDYALKEMADRVLPDLGVLKAYPVAPMGGRRLEFINGMAANERYGFLGNWERMGFADQDPEAQPGLWLSTVINNREDRVPRSQVFAEILVRDARADRHFLIGGNLSGFLSYVREAWERFAGEYRLWSDTDGDDEAARGKFLADARDMRIAVTQAQVQARSRAMLEGLGIPAPAIGADVLGSAGEALRSLLHAHDLEQHAEAIESHWRGLRQEQQECARMLERIAAGGDREALRDEAVEQLWRWLRARIVVLDDIHISGDAIIARIRDETPPGYHNRIMGCQNIKGPGLDFVYRWQAWDRCHQACALIRTGKEPAVEAGLGELVEFQSFNPVCEEYLRETLEGLRHRDVAQSEQMQSRIHMIETALKQQLAAADRQGGSAHGGGGWLAGLIHAVEAFLDAGDAVKRRKRADRIYRDLVAERISQARAVTELQALNRRQKGGWLLARLQRFMSRLGGSGPE